MASLSLRGKALAWLAQREHSRLELQQKLERYARKVQAGVEDIAPLLDALQAAGHLSDSRFVESRVHARLSRFGNRRIEQELRAKGVVLDEDLRAQLQSQLRESELMRAQRVFEAKFGRSGDPSPDESSDPASEPASKPSPQLRARQARFLAARGFSAATVAQVLKGAGVAEDAAEDTPEEGT